MAIEKVIVLPRHGTIDDAIALIAADDGIDDRGPTKPYEIQIRYNNGDVIEARFDDKAGALAFLQRYKA